MVGSVGVDQEQGLAVRLETEMDPRRLSFGLVPIGEQARHGLAGAAGLRHQRPPPAQAHAQPAQAQAQAHERPPEDAERDEGGGGGLVVRVTPEVNSVMLLTREPAVFCTPRAKEAANSAPGRWGREIPPPPRPAEIRSEERR